MRYPTLTYLYTIIIPPYILALKKKKNKHHAFFLCRELSNHHEESNQRYMPETEINEANPPRPPHHRCQLVFTIGPGGTARINKILNGAAVRVVFGKQ